LIPITSTPSKFARIVAALITLFIPGAGPPATRTAIFLGAIVISEFSSMLKPFKTGVNLPINQYNFKGYYFIP
jgi:hypothetical protein